MQLSRGDFDDDNFQYYKNKQKTLAYDIFKSVKQYAKHLGRYFTDILHRFLYREVQKLRRSKFLSTIVYSVFLGFNECLK